MWRLLESTVCCMVQQVSWALCQHKATHIKMPSEEQKQAAAARMMQKYQLPRFAYTIDGMMVRFDSAPRDLPGCRTSTAGRTSTH
jgi:hypothetical protein